MANSTSSAPFVAYAVFSALLLQLLYTICQEAYKIRLYAINEFGRIIHEFDPYFNYRATVYLYENGWEAFSKWFDYKVWYPLGRPVGTTIFPGMQATSVWIKNHILPEWSINDICVFVPAWFGVLATLSVAWLTYECTRHKASHGSILSDFPVTQEIYRYVILPIVSILLSILEMAIPSSSAWGLRPPVKDDQYNLLAPFACAVSAAAIMSILPAHLLRSIGGGYDNESIAMTAMVLTFSTWTFSLRSDWNNLYITTLLGAVSGLAYFYMVAAWGGYVFVVNLVASHAGWLVLTGRYSKRLHRSYTAFYIVGTSLATTVPVVGWMPLRSLEQMAPLIGFVGLQLIETVEILKVRNKWNFQQTWKVRITLFAVTGAIAAVLAYFLLGQGYFGPISSRIRGLFVEHTKTGNPLVDSVAEHQAASKQAYLQYLHHVYYILPFGLVQSLLFAYNDSSSFLLVYGVASYYFSLKMVRLILLTAPIASVLGGIAIGKVLSWGILSAVLIWSDTEKPEMAKIVVKKDKSKAKKARKQPESSNGSEEKDTNADPLEVLRKDGLPWILRGLRVAAALYAVYIAKPYAEEFYKRSHQVAESISHPTIIQKARTKNGDIVFIDDYREAYFWLRDNTPEDARIMAWWDYGYQITGIANRTTIADGNTWNHEHIALLGRTLTAPETEAHRIARHLADYVLVWAGGGGDDLAKSPHLRRIANSVYRGLCKEPTCRDYGFYSNRVPTERMKESLLYILHSNRINPGVEVDRNRFREVFASKYGKVRIYKVQSVSQESKEWVLNNRACDAPGSWFCPGLYPPALKEVLAQKRDFAQLEDFNRQEGRDDDYTKEYFENLNKKHHLQQQDQSGSEQPKNKIKKLSKDVIEQYNEKWENNEITTLMWELIAHNRLVEMRDLIASNPSVPHLRSEDGRGPMWWAHEYKRSEVVEFLKKLGVTEDRKDANGITPLDLKA